MKRFLVLWCFAFSLGAAAEERERSEGAYIRAGEVYIDLFAAREGAVVYPQFKWRFEMRAGTLRGFDFAEGAPGEGFFTNHLVGYSPPWALWLGVHAEVGGFPHAAPRTGFVQMGPRLNIEEMHPRLKKSMEFITVAALPRFIGIRPNNLLAAASTRKFRAARGVEVSVEGFRRFVRHEPDYAEYWLMAFPQKTPHLGFGFFVLRSEGRTIPAFGIRIY